jgi:hypothetical protein
MSRWHHPYTGPEVPGWLVITFLLLGVLLSIWVYRDARDRACVSPLVWAVAIFVGWFFTLVLGIVLFIVYLVRRPEPLPPSTDG